MYPYSRLKRFSRPLTSYQKVVRGRSKFQALVRGHQIRKKTKFLLNKRGKYADFRRKIWHGVRNGKYSLPQVSRATDITANRIVKKGMNRMAAVISGIKTRKMLKLKKRAATIVNPYKKKPLNLFRAPVGKMANPYWYDRWWRNDYKYRVGDAKIAHGRMHQVPHRTDDGRRIRVDYATHGPKDIRVLW